LRVSRPAILASSAVAEAGYLGDRVVKIAARAGIT
jgi:hypothetical protein